MTPEFIPFNTDDESDPNQYINKALKLVNEEIDIHKSKSDVAPYQTYVVWFSKTLQNWKALLSTSRSDGLYYEVTYDGDKGVAYVDTYGKVRNTPVWDDLRLEAPNS